VLVLMQFRYFSEFFSFPLEMFSLFSFLFTLFSAVFFFCYAMMVVESGLVGEVWEQSSHALSLSG
jgi:hypothetical protein